MNIDIVVLRLLHIVSGAFWVGTILFMALILRPKLRSLGPSGTSETKPVGLVYIGLASSHGLRVEKYQFPGTRRQVKRWTSQAALNLVRLELLEH